MRVVIVGKTRMHGGRWCVGGLILNAWAQVRLVERLEDNGWPCNVPFEVGQTWDIEGSHPPNLKPPHTENFLVSKKELVGTYGLSLPEDIASNVRLARGAIESLYDGCLETIPSKSLRVIEGCVPNYSTQFWVPTTSLQHVDDYYWTDGRRIKFVGAQEAADIAAGSLVRLSLSSWFRPSGHTQDGCYLQLSGWWPPPKLGAF